MNTDLLALYIKANRVSLFHYLFIAFVFLYARVQLYPEYSITALTGGALLLCIAVFFLIRQQRIYTRAIRQKITREDIKKLSFQIALNKAGYIIPWLVVLFWPFQAPALYEHMLGYIFVFSSIALYASTSSAYFRLFLWDVGLPVAFAALITAVNSHLPLNYIFYISAALSLSFVFALLLGRKLYQSTAELVKKQYQLEDAMIKAGEASRAKSDFLAIMSHEIRTPMTGMLGMINYLKETGLSEDQKECVETIDSCSATLLNTLNDVLDVSTIEAGKFSIEPQNFDLAKNIRTVVKTIRLFAESKNLYLRTELAEDLPDQIFCDPNRFQQVLINLLNNAIKFTEKGGVTLTVAMVDNGTRLKIEITDTGIGIAAHEIGDIFEKFSQVKTATNRSYEGTGLGLSISKSLVELMGGTIGVEVLGKKENGETKFWFELPYIPPVIEEVAAPRAHDYKKFSHLRVLLVEDNPVNVMAVEKILSRKLHALHVASNGEEALAALQQAEIDLIFMDLNLPGKDGIEIAQDIQDLGGAFKDIPIIALTANTVEKNLEACYEAGMVGHVFKPFRSEDLYAALVKYGMDTNLEPSRAQKEPAQKKAVTSHLQAMAEEFGPDYTRQYIQKALSSLNNLLAQLKSESEKAAPGRESIYHYGHEIKGVSASLDMNQTAACAATLEKLGQGELQAGDTSRLVAELEDLIEKERPEPDFALAEAD